MPASARLSSAPARSAVLVAVVLTAAIAAPSVVRAQHQPHQPPQRHLVAVLHAGPVAGFENVRSDSGLSGFGQDVGALLSGGEAQRNLRSVLDHARWYFFSDGSFTFVPPLTGPSAAEQMYVIWGRWQVVEGTVRFAGRGERTIANAHHARSAISGVIGRTAQGQLAAQFDYELAYGSTSHVTASNTSLACRCVQPMAPAGQR